MTDMSTLTGEAGFYVERGALSCRRCGDCNYDENTLICITCTHPDDPSSKAYLDGRVDQTPSTLRVEP